LESGRDARTGDGPNVTGAAAKETIAAISTPPGRGALGVIRISGPSARDVVRPILRRIPPWIPRQAVRVDIRDEQGRELDQGLLTWFPAPRSYTGEDVVELSLHGSPIVLRAVLDRLCQHGARLALPGEFSFRAFLHGKLDLPQAEAVRALIDATTLYQARVALQQVHGSVSRRLAAPKRELVDLIALLEAGIDFAEDDVSVASTAEILDRLRGIRDHIARLLASFAYGQLVENGASLAIVGRPNVGKSSLFNRLIGQDRAIVTDIAGTTRDLISEVASLGGIPIKFLDTAGVRESADLVETLGIERTFQAMADADLTLVVIDLSVPLADADHQLVERARQGGRHLIVANKCDLPPRALVASDAIPVSAVTGEGIPMLKEAITAALGATNRESQEEGFITSLRHAQHLRECARFLEQAATSATSGIPHEMLLLDLYAALQQLDAITGATTADDILNRIFSTFCIGK